MKITKLISKSIIILLIGLVIISCKKDEEPEPINYDYENAFIEINENSSYNQKNFSNSISQITDSYWMWASDFTSHYDQNFKLELSIMNLSIYRDFGEGYVTYQHYYNEQGVIIYSKFMDEKVWFDNYMLEYEYDKQGYIIKLTVKIDNEIWDVTNFEYDNNYKLLTKTYIAPTGEEYGLESFTYNENGKISTLVRGNYMEEYVYDNNQNVIEMKRFENDGYIGSTNLDYDGYSSIIKMYYDEVYSTYEYTDRFMIIRWYEGDKLMLYVEIGYGYMPETSRNYFYTEEDIFDYCIQGIMDELGFEKELYMYNGEVDDLAEVGKSIITERHIPSYRPLEQLFIDLTDNVIYINTCNVVEETDEGHTYWDTTDVKWYSADGTEIEATDITEDWVLELSRIHEYRSLKSNDLLLSSPKSIIERIHQ